MQITTLSLQAVELAARLQSTEDARADLQRDNMALHETITSLQDQLAARRPPPAQPTASIGRLELESRINARLLRADDLLLENQRLRTELATLTLPPHELSRAVRDYATTKQHDLTAALTAHRADYERQQRWLTRFEDRDPTFEPWLEDEELPYTTPPDSSPNAG